jgi:hypothetical protein
MKRAFQTVLLLSCLVTVVRAGDVTIGVRAGSSIPDLRDNGGNELSRGWSSRLAASFGAFADLEIKPAFSVEAEVNYAGQGGKKDGLQPIITDVSALPVPPGTTLYADFKNVAKLNYLEIPVLASFHFGSARRFFARVGPYVGILLSAKTVTSGESTIYLDAKGEEPIMLVPGGDPLPPQNFDATTDGKADLHNFNWGFQAGVGVVQPVGPGQVSLDVRGGLGLANIQRDTAVNGKNRTGDLVIALGYGVRLGRR